MKKYLLIFVIIVAALLGVEFRDYLPLDTVEEEWATVRFVFDGDTIEVDLDGKRERVRYIGIDSPERPNKEKAGECFFQEASDYNRELSFGRNVRLVKDISNRDKYGRLLRYVYLDDGRDVNLEMVREGYAIAKAFPPDIARRFDFEAAEELAQQERVGLWGMCEMY